MENGRRIPRIEGTIDATVLLMFLGIFGALGFLIWVEKWFPQDGQIFQVVVGILGMFGGVMAARVDPNKSKVPTPTQPTGSTIISSSTTTTTSQEPHKDGPQ